MNNNPNSSWSKTDILWHNSTARDWCEKQRWHCVLDSDGVCVRVCVRVRVCARVRVRGCDSEKWIRARGFLSGYLLLRPPCPGNPGSNSTQKCLGLFLLCSPCHTPLTESTLIRDHNATSLKLTWSWKDKLNPSYFWRARIRPGGRRVRTWRRCETSGPWVILL